MIRVFLCLGISLLTLTGPQQAFAKTNILLQTSDPAFITHKVVAGETLFAISRKYGVSVAELTKLNPETKKGLRAGQSLRVPNKKTAENPVAAEKPKVEVPAKPEPIKPEPKPTTTTANVTSGNGKIHKVATRETLYSIAVKNGVTMAEIRKWNNLKSDKLQLGQKLIVSAPATAAEPEITTVPKTEIPGPAKPVVVKNETKVKGDKVKTETKTITPKAELPNDTVKDSGADKNESKTVVSDIKGSDGTTYEVGYKVVETGLAEVIAGENNKFLALHKTAPVGTILQVKNIMNGQNVYVRVIGKLPDTGVNDKVIVRISKKAYQRLAALDNRFRVEVSYMP